MSRRARTRPNKRAPWQDQDNNTTAAYGRFSFGRVATNIILTTEALLQGFAGSFILPFAGCKL